MSPRIWKSVRNEKINCEHVFKLLTIVKNNYEVLTKIINNLTTSNHRSAISDSQAIWSPRVLGGVQGGPRTSLLNVWEHRWGDPQGCMCVRARGGQSVNNVCPHLIIIFNNC